MGFNEREKQKYEEYFAQLKTQESAALANELATILAMVPLMPVDKIMEQVRENSRIIRSNKRITTHNNKVDRLRKLTAKKRLSRAEQQEALTLAKELGFKG